MVKVKCFDSLTRGRGKMGSYRVRPVRPVSPRPQKKCSLVLPGSSGGRNLGSSEPKPDHPDLLSTEIHCLAESSGVTQDDPTMCRKIVQECFVSDNSLKQMVKHF